MSDDNKIIVQSVIDRLLYCQEYKQKLLELNQQYDPHKDRKYETDVTKFKFKEDTGET
jgi:hypothetical protein